MSRRKRVHPMLRVAQKYARTQRPDLVGAPMRVRQIDGPPGSPRFAVNIEGCRAETCPFAIPPEVREAGECDIPCELRDTCRLLLDREGTVITATESSEHYS